jgi:hypothetical protein
MDYKAVATVAGIALAGSEILSLYPKTKANGWVQLGLQALRLIAANGRKR